MDFYWFAHIIGRVCAEIVNCCPPCVPVAVPGQVITNNVVEYLSTQTDIETIEVAADGVSES